MTRNVTFTEEVVLVTESCCACGMLFATTKAWSDQRRGDKQTFYCPNGHSQSYTGKSLRDQVATLEAEKTALQSRVNSEREATRLANAKADREASKRKAIEKRVAAGACPYCKRSFQESRLAKHIHTKHPDEAHA
jgi:hypothetical protein